MQKKFHWNLSASGLVLSLVIHIALVAIVCGVHPFHSFQTEQKQPGPQTSRRPIPETVLAPEFPVFNVETSFKSPVTAIVEPISSSDKYPTLIE